MCKRLQNLIGWFFEVSLNILFVDCNFGQKVKTFTRRLINEYNCNLLVIFSFKKLENISMRIWFDKFQSTFKS